MKQLHGEGNWTNIESGMQEQSVPQGENGADHLTEAAIRKQCGQLACRNIGRGGCPLENPHLTDRYRLDLAQTCIAALGKRQPQRRP